MFDAHVPDRYRDRAPRVVDEADGSQQWYYGDIRGRNLGLNAVAGKSPEIFNVDPLRYEHMRPGCYDVHERVRDMSAGGQLAGLNFPNWTGFSGQVLNQGPDRDVNLVMIKAYNDWHVDEWCGAYPERFIPCGILPLFDVHEAAREVHRLAAKGCHAVTFSENPAGLGHAEHPLRRVGSAVRGVLRDRHRAVLPRRFVVEERVDVARRARAGPDEPVVGDGDLHARRSPVGRLLAPVPAAALRAHRGRHRLDPVLPAARRAHARPAQRMDAPRAPQGLSPTELFRERILCCFINDRVGVKLLDEFNVDNVCWESDYPHSDSSWPERARALRGAVRRARRARSLPASRIATPCATTSSIRSRTARPSAARSGRCGPRRPTSTW